MRAGLLEGEDDDYEDDDFSLRRSIASSIRGMYGRRAERERGGARRAKLTLILRVDGVDGSEEAAKAAVILGQVGRRKVGAA